MLSVTQGLVEFFYTEGTCVRACVHACVIAMCDCMCVCARTCMFACVRMHVIFNRHAEKGHFHNVLMYYATTREKQSDSFCMISCNFIRCMRIHW